MNIRRALLLIPVLASPLLLTGCGNGSIDGYTTAGANVYAEQDGSIIRSTSADSTGYFNLTSLDMNNGNYDVVISGSTSNTAYNTTVIASVPVNATSATSVSTSSAPLTLATTNTGTVSGTVNTSASATVYAQQVINGLTYVIALTTPDSSSGNYAFTLPTTAPLYATYNSSGTTPSAVSSSAGAYTIEAISTANNTQSSAITVASGGTTTVNFTSLN